MNRIVVAAGVMVAVTIAVSAIGPGHAQDSAGALTPPTYTAAQAVRGQAIYAANCAECHGKSLDDGEFAAALKGPQFHQHWGAGGLDGPYNVMLTQMPPTNPGSLPPQSYVDVLAYVLSQNGIQANADKELPADAAALAKMASPH